MPYRIIGQAAPFNVENSYHEILLPGSLDEFLALPEARDLPMRVGHDRQVGVWNHLHVAGGWLHCMGTLDDRNTEQEVRNGMSELSIGYHNADVIAAFDAAKDMDEKHAAMAESRIGRGIDYIAKMMCEMPTEAVMRKLAELDGMSFEERKDIAIEACIKSASVERVARAKLHEISIVSRGSFRNTRLHWEKI